MINPGMLPLALSNDWWLSIAGLSCPAMLIVLASPLWVRNILAWRRIRRREREAGRRGFEVGARERGKGS